MNTKAEAGMGEMLKAIIQLVLVVIVIIALWGLLVKLGNVFISDEEEATKRNFERLVASINTMKTDDPQSYPLYLDDSYAVVGYHATKDHIGGTCTYGDVLNTKKIQFTFKNTKPWQCGTETLSGCLCLCTLPSDPKDLCQEDEDVITCVGNDYFDTPLSFEGGTQRNDKGEDIGSCPYALILGTGTSQPVHIKRSTVKDQEYDTVHICMEQCE